MAEKLEVSELQIVDDEGRPRMILSAYPMIQLFDEEGGVRGIVSLANDGHGGIEFRGPSNEKGEQHSLILHLHGFGPDLMLKHADGSIIRLYWAGDGNPQIVRKPGVCDGGGDCPPRG